MNIMEAIEEYIKTIESAMEYIHPDFNDENHVDDALFHHMRTRHYFRHKDNRKDIYAFYTLEEYIRNFYASHINKHMTEDFKIRRTRAISSAIVNRIDTMSVSSLCYLYNTPGFKFFKRLVDCPNLVVAQEVYGIMQAKHHPYLASNFDISTYYRIISISSRNDLSLINAIEIKRNILIQHLYNAINAILGVVHHELCTIGLIAAEENNMDIIEHLQLIHTCCKDVNLDSLISKKTISGVDKTALFLPYCKGFPSKESNRDLLLQFLDKLQERFLIHPSMCNKTKFSALALILFRAQDSICLKKNAFKSYNKFKESLATYYGMPNNSLKPKNLKEAVTELLNSNFCLEKINLIEFIKN